MFFGSGRLLALFVCFVRLNHAEKSHASHQNPALLASDAAEGRAWLSCENWLTMCLEEDVQPSSSPLLWQRWQFTQACSLCGDGF